MYEIEIEKQKREMTYVRLCVWGRGNVCATVCRYKEEQRQGEDGQVGMWV